MIFDLAEASSLKLDQALMKKSDQSRGKTAHSERTPVLGNEIFFMSQQE